MVLAPPAPADFLPASLFSRHYAPDLLPGKSFVKE
jgi:hypothetical protein